MSEDPEFGESRRAALRGWCKSLERAAQDDGWGQVVEAVEAYEQCVHCLCERMCPVAAPRSGGGRAGSHASLIFAPNRLGQKIMNTLDALDPPSSDRVRVLLLLRCACACA